MKLAVKTCSVVRAWRTLKNFGLGICLVGLQFVFGPPALATPMPFGSNYYEFVEVTDPFTGNNNSWFVAKAAAQVSVFNGVNGHLATVTSQAENNFLLSLVSGSFTGFKGAWLGGKDPEGWLDGPENGMAFSYTNWGGVEPNNAGYAYMSIGAGGVYAPGLWADDSGVQGFPDPDSDPVIGYFVEYENAPMSAVSRKVHGGVGDFDIDLPLSGTPGVECRSGGATNDYTMVVTFGTTVTVTGNPQAQITLGMGNVGSGGVSNGGMVTVSGSTVTVPLTNVVNAQTINVTLNGVNGSSNVVIPMSVLVADSNGNGAVNAGDVAQTKSRIGQALTSANFRSDPNTNGAINGSDVSLIKSRIGTALP